MNYITLFETGLPEVLMNLIIEFAYLPIKDISLLNTLANNAWLITRDSPIPVSWKKLKLRNAHRFDWNNFLKTEMNPWCIHTIIDLRSVRRTIEALNWSALKHQDNAACLWTRRNTKKSVLNELKTWSPKTSTYIFYIQRILCCIDIPKCLNRPCKCNIPDVIVANTQLLSFFINPPRFGL